MDQWKTFCWWHTAWKVSRYGVFSGPYFSVFRLDIQSFSPKTGKYGPEKTPYLDFFSSSDTSLFNIVKDKSESPNATNNDLSLILKWTFKLKILLNPDPNKPVQEVLFSRKKSIDSSNHKLW